MHGDDNDNEGGEVVRRVVAFLGPEDNDKLRHIGRALINVLDALAPDPETDDHSKALQLAAATLLQAAVYRRFGATGIDLQPNVVPDGPPQDMRP